MRILLIEDDRALCTALLPALQAAGYTVDTCHDSADGKALLCVREKLRAKAPER